MYEAKGIVLAVFDEQQITEKFKKREFILEVANGAYTEKIKFQLANEKCSLIAGYMQGLEIKVFFNIKGSSSDKNGTTMYFTNLDAWKIEQLTAHQMPTPAPASAPVEKQRNFVPPTPPATRPNVAPQAASDEDDLPF